MNVTTRQVVSMRAIAMLVSTALVLLVSGAHMFTRVAEASNLTSVSDTLTDSAPLSASDHTIAFTSPDGMAQGENFTLTIPTGFDASSVTVSDLALSVNGTVQTLATATPAAGTWGVVGAGSNSITFTTPTSGGIASSSALILYIGANASGTNQIVNASTSKSYEFHIAGSMQDSAYFRIALVNNVAVTAQVNTTLIFTVNGTSSSVTVNGSPTTTASGTSATALPFGSLDANVSKTLAQDLTVTTNAKNGYTVTVYEDHNLQSSTGADIDNFIDGSSTSTPVAWQAPSNNVNDENTWGHWGITSNDFTLNGSGTNFATDTWMGVSTTPRAIMDHTGPADGTTLGIGRATIGYQIQITPLQEAGDDYNTTLTYIATPTF